MHRAVEIALGEVGYLEKDTPEALDEKETNAGSANFTKYARDMDAIGGFYNGSKQGCPWCDVFVDWCFVKAYGETMARALLCQPKKSKGAGCRYSMEYYQQEKRLFSQPEPGDQIFFQTDGKVCHTGIVTGIKDGQVHTVEGNTSSEPGVVANGGCVREKCYPLDSPVIAGYGRPDYAMAECPVQV